MSNSLNNPLKLNMQFFADKAATGNTRIVEIETRMAEIETEVETADGETLDNLLTETRALKTERETIEKRAALLEDVRTGRKGTPIEKPAPKYTGGHVEQRTYSVDDVEYRNAWAKTLLCQPLTEVERRALLDANRNNRNFPEFEMEMRQQEAITTTATEYVQPSSGVVGINNGGLFIPKYVSDLLLDQIALGSPILEDVRKMSVAGMISYPYKKYADPAKWVEEGVCNDLESIEWDELKSTMHELSKTIRTTWRLEALTPDSFINYLIQELRLEMQEERVRGLVYGTGGLEPTGIEMSSAQGTYTVDGLFDSISEAGERIPAKFLAGAKLYVSRTLANKIALTKNKDGSYVLPPINNNKITGVTSFPVEMDPYLRDGDAILGNLRQGVILNTVEPVSITKDVSGRCKINDYTAWELLSIFVLPGYTIFLQEDSTPTP